MTNILEMCFCLHFVDIGTYTIQLCLHNLFPPLCLLATSTCWLTLQLYTIWGTSIVSSQGVCVTIIVWDLCYKFTGKYSRQLLCMPFSCPLKLLPVHTTYAVLSQWRQIENCFLHPSKWGCPLGVSMQFVPDYLSAEESADIAVVPNWYHLVHQIAETLGKWVCSYCVNSIRFQSIPLGYRSMQCQGISTFAKDWRFTLSLLHIHVMS